MKVSDQLKQVKNGFEVSNHVFVNKLMVGLQKEVSQTIPDLKLQPINKQGGKGLFSVTLTGQIALDPVSDDPKRTQDKIRQLMDSLKNKSNLLSLLK